MRYLMISLILFAVSCSAPVIDNDLSLYQVHNNTIVERFVFTPSLEREIRLTPSSLRPTDNDLYTSSVDLNNDGGNDILAVIKHYKFSKDNKYKLFIFIKSKDGYLELSPHPFVSFKNIKVLSTTTNDYHDISADGYILKFSNNAYK